VGAELDAPESDLNHLEIVGTWHKTDQRRLTQKRRAAARLQIEFTRPYQAVWYG